MINLLVEVACIRVYEGYTQPKNKKLPMVFDLIVYLQVNKKTQVNSFSWLFGLLFQQFFVIVQFIYRSIKKNK